jgi:hypothetical protein
MENKIKNPVAKISESEKFSNTVNYIKDLLTAGPQGATGKGMELGIGAVLARTALKRLPVPLNFVAPMIAEKVIMKYGVEEGRELLLKGLRWVKKATDEKPVSRI